MAGIRRVVTFICLVLASTPTFAAGVVVDGATNTTLDNAANGVPVVNIATPNAGGLSHNSYIQFNVDPTGLILNNANQTVVDTQLGGQIFGNSNLIDPAKVILNEVTSTNPSLLNGYTEVAGQAADVVIANPNGISINGAGFLNAPRVTLTTGLPDIDAFGNLGGFDVRGGEITIGGLGLDTRAQDATSIYTHFLTLNAKLHAQDLDIALGKNQIDYPGRKIVSSSKGSVQRILLDSSALGGMYVNKITLVGSDSGLGVNLPPEVIASNGDIRISNDGRIQLQQLDATGDIVVASSDSIDSNASLFSRGTTGLEAQQEVNIDSGMVAARDRVEIASDRLTNDGTLIAGLDADGDLNSWGVVDIRSREVINRGEVNAQRNAFVSADSIVNQGLFTAAHDLTLSSINLVNESTLFTGFDMRLLVRDRLENKTDAAVFAVRDLLLAADDAGGRTAQISNDLGSIQTLQGDIDIYAGRFDNLGTADIRYDVIYFDLGNDREVGDPGAAMTIDLAYDTGYTKHNSTARRRWVNEVLARLQSQAPHLYADNAASISSNRYARFLAIETQLVDYSITTPALLDSGNDLNLHVDDFSNVNSIVSASNNIDFDVAGNYDNYAESSSEAVTDYDYYTRAKHSRNWKSDDKYSSVGRSGYIPVGGTKTVSANTVTQAGGSISGQVGGQAVNSGVLLGQYQSSGFDRDDFDASAISLPNNQFGLFVRATDPDSQFLIETNPQFTDFGNFIGSSYLLDRLDFSAQAEMKRLGDAFYEMKLIREGVFAQSGQRYLDPSLRSDQQQFQFLMDNALMSQQALQLLPGVALTEDQINRLTADIVWLEQQQVEGQAVLVPRVYLAHTRSADVRGGQIVAGDKVSLQVAELRNSGLIGAGGSLTIDAGDAIVNRGALVAEGDLTLEADRLIENRSGRIRGGDVALIANDGDIVNRRHTEDAVTSGRDYDRAATLVGEAGVIEADNSLSLEARGEIRIEGSRLAGADISLEADAVDIRATAKNESFISGDKDNFVREESLKHFASTVVGGNIVVLSTGATGVSGSRLEAEQELRITAGSIDIDAVNDSQYRASRSTLEGNLSETVATSKRLRSQNRGSELNATTVVLVTDQGDIELTGSQIQAGMRLAMNSAGAIRVEAGRDGSLDERYRHKTGWFSGGSLYSETEDLAGRVAETAVKSQLSAGNFELVAVDDIDLRGVDIAVDDGLVARARDISIRNAENSETSYSKHTEISIGLDDLASSLSEVDELIDIEDGKLTAQIAEASYLHADSVSTETTVVASQIGAGNIHLDAAGEHGGDIRIQGSDLAADDAIRLDASGEVALLDAQHSKTSEEVKQEGTATLSFTVQNEYEQLVRAIKEVKAAESDLRHAEDDYDDYRDELKQQEQAFSELQQSFLAGGSFIEQADIDDFERRLDRLRDDEDFYKTNIALAAVTLTSKTTALIKQGAQAAGSSATYGFNAGLQFDIDAFETEINEYYLQSRGSNLAASEIEINAGETAVVRGSNLQARDSIEINAEDIEILAGVNSSSSDEREQQVEFSYSWNLVGGPSGTDPAELGGSLSGDTSRSENQATQHVNSQLLAANISLTANSDTRIHGADIHADNRLEINSENLSVASVQDSSFGQTRSQGLSHSGSGGGANAAEGDNESVQTLITRLSGQQVEINTSDHTEIKGAVIAAIDEDGKDNGQLSMSTNTLSASSLNNSVDNSNRSIALQGGETATLNYQNNGEFDRTKSLATLGTGDIQINDAEGSDIRFLNTDIENTEVAIYDLESHQGLSGELDTRLLTADGHRQIAEDWLKTEMIANSIELIISTERVGIEDFFEETDKFHRVYETVKEQVRTDPDLAAMLQNPALTPDQKQQMLDQLTGAVMEEFKLAAYDNLIIATDKTTPGGEDFYGFYSTETGQAYINDVQNNNTRDLLTTAGHEAAHAMDDQSGLDINDPNSRQDNNVYAGNFGENFAGYADFSLEYHGYDGLAISNDHVGIDSELVSFNTTEFGGFDKEQGDFRLTEQQLEDKAQELADCSNFLCVGYVEEKYSLISTGQGAAEITGVASGAVIRVVDDLRELVRITDEILENPEKAEQVAAYLNATLIRANEIVEGDQFSAAEKQQFVSTVNGIANDFLNSLEDAENLDGSGLSASFGEGEKYGAFAASLIPLAKFSKYLKNINNATEANTVENIERQINLDPDNDFQVSDADDFRSQIGESVKPYINTNINGKVKVVEQEDLPMGILRTYRNSEYLTVETTDEVVLYRKFGGIGDQAKIDGGFASTSPNSNRNELAIYKEWSTMRFEVEISVPPGQKLNIGRVAEQPVGSGNPKYRGNADQVLLPRNYPTEWVTSIRDGKTGEVYTVKEFAETFPDQFKQ